MICLGQIQRSSAGEASKFGYLLSHLRDRCSANGLRKVKLTGFGKVYFFSGEAAQAVLSLSVRLRTGASTL